jgi:hypothetical protein
VSVVQSHQSDKKADATVTDNYVLSVGDLRSSLVWGTDRQIVIVVVLLSADFWFARVCRAIRRVNRVRVLKSQNVAGRTLVGLRYFNEVDAEGNSAWVFESRDVSHGV